MDIEQALSTLSEANLFAKFIGGEDQKIIGGTEVEVCQKFGIEVYQDTFAILKENSDWTAVVVGPGMLDTTVKVASLEEAVAQILRIYSEKALSR
jgi:hypothetical protein